jgi:DNA-binding MarR family transcriptional regulator
MSADAGTFILIPDTIAKRTDLSGDEKLVIGCLARMQGHNACCWPSFETIASECGISRRHAVRIISRLSKAGEITKLNRAYRSNVYSVRFATIRNLRRAWALKRSAPSGDILASG